MGGHTHSLEVAVDDRNLWMGVVSGMSHVSVALPLNIEGRVENPFPWGWHRRIGKCYCVPHHGTCQCYA